VKKYGTKKWEEIAAFMPKRCGRQCRNRYFNSLMDTLKKGPWAPEEDAIVLDKHSEIGAHWVQISKFLPGRSGNDVKNRWYKFLSKRVAAGQVDFPRLTSPVSRPAIDLAREIQTFCEGQQSLMADFRDEKAAWDLFPATDGSGALSLEFIRP
jgi:hypothetical protein